MAIFSSQNRRRATRVSLKTQVRYRLNGDGAAFKRAQALEYSADGIRLRLNDELPVGTQLYLELPIPSSFQLSTLFNRSFQLDRPLRSEGRVVWVAPSFSSDAAWECGITLSDSRQDSGREGFMAFIADMLCRLGLRCTPDMTASPAESLEEMKAAYRLAYKEYLARGYCEPNPAQMHYSHFCLLPESCTFVLKRHSGPLLGTITLTVDSPCGLPLESIFPDEINQLRAGGRRLAEVGFLALDLDAVGRKSFSLAEIQKQATLFRLFKIMFDYARFVGGVTDLIIGMHPKHAMLYRYLTFETLGPVRTYPGACGKPALLMRMDIRRTEREISTQHGKGAFFLKDPMALELLERHYQWTPEAVQELLIERRPLWETLSPAAREYLISCYPGVSR